MKVLICFQWRKCVNSQEYKPGLIFGLAILKSLLECSFLVFCWLTELGDGEREAGLLDVSGLWPAGNKKHYNLVCTKRRVSVTYQHIIIKIYIVFWAKEV